jgi:hypothetical protein
MISDREIAGCFGEMDLLFANHPSDAARAFELLIKLRTEQAPWRDVRSSFERFLRAKRCDEQHLQEQIAVLKRRFAPWLFGDVDDD